MFNTAELNMIKECLETEQECLKDQNESTDEIDALIAKVTKLAEYEDMELDVLLMDDDGDEIELEGHYLEDRTLSIPMTSEIQNAGDEHFIRIVLPHHSDEDI